jgi:hypothetical protein
MILTSPRNADVHKVFEKFELVQAMPDVSSMIYRQATRLFAVDGVFAFAGFWFSSYLRSYDMLVSNADCLERLRVFMRDHEWWFVFDEYINTIYFASSYIHPSEDRLIKRHINRVFMGIQERANTLLPVPVPLPAPTAANRQLKHVAVITQ